MSENAGIQADLRYSDLFFDFDDLLLELVASISERRRYKFGEVIFEEGSESDKLYIIIQGEVEIQVSPAVLGLAGSDPKTIAVLRRGQNFGEIALLDAGPRTASALCIASPTQLIVIQRERINLMCENVPKLGYLLMRNLATDLAMKVRNTDIEIRSHLFWSPPERS